MGADLNVKHLFNSLFNGLDPGITEFNDFSRICKNDMVMVAVKIRFLVLCLVISKLVLSHQPAFQKKLNGIV